MTDDTITIEVNGQPFEAQKGQMLIEVTDKNNIYIPRFCYHHKLSVAANCRMCMVEVDKVPKPLPACATPVMDGMKVYTKSARAIDAQKSVMEFLLINHPLDCPICDQGGECELQDLAMGYGRDISRYQEKKRVVQDKNIGPLVQTDMTRCIHCTRCIRFGDEVAGLRELGATGRGEHMEIGTYIEQSMVSEMSGNVIDICPVGALTSKPFRFSARAWEMIQRDSIAPHDAVGSNIHIHIKGDQVKRVVPAENESINEVWLSDRDRFSYEGLYSDDRLTTPMVKENNEWKEVEWETALEFVKENLQAVINNHGEDSVGALASPTSTLEELYLFQKFIRGIDIPNIDHRFHQRDFSDQEIAPVFPWLGQFITDLERLDVALLIGSNIRKEQPIMNHRLRKANLQGCKTIVVNSVDYEFNFNITEKLITPPNEITFTLAAILKALTELETTQLNDDIIQSIDTVQISEKHYKIARYLIESKQGTVLLGNLASAHPQYAMIRQLAGAIAKCADISMGYLGEFANTSGAWLAGVLPHKKPAAESADRKGLDAHAMLDVPLKAYVLLGFEPEIDCWDGRQALHAMTEAEFVVTLTAFRTAAMNQYANVMLPIALFAETSGTYINNEGRSQSFCGVVTPPGEARPAWKILRVLGNQFKLPGFDYNTSVEIRDELQPLIDKLVVTNDLKLTGSMSLQSVNGDLQRVTEIPMNAIDPLTRRARALQQTSETVDNKIHISIYLAQRLNLQNGDMVKIEQDDSDVELPILIDDRIPDGCALVHAGQSCHAQLGAWAGEITLTKV